MLKIMLAVFLGGGTGSVLRWWLGLRLNPVHHAIPLGTLTANLAGAFIIGAGLVWFNRMTHLDPMWKLLITTGLCGGLTTFSTFSAEVVFLLQEGRIGWAGLNVMLNLLGSFMMTALAFWLFSSVNMR
ncbi:fluoride efflux transporter CrcB [Cronobacter muytjensii]|uniref:Fluoride-specific ion channel FluC n=1 Tax=Cronobacter muytjensii TaxID=413501 RepID=A0A2T7AZ99_9ENTR|nr:fluoride efflux transporter CrcB [Cronobacter muytjensii]ELY6273713.1 fluoride efflux transporter CrcB [Cronobacter muytjensii]KAB0878847.1 fluoride efflux transporter CrcB [Cronobacter muytjensii]MBF4811085.1 fluoride efflux transporter CrcB [Cronobacter muytjensii]MDI6455304.1 fluoride efflux transporter CrcB [Cronobacter muytjensii]MEB8639839.1 fluoride efflux transporter CrcB [Cronobacter muytjensii]